MTVVAVAGPRELGAAQFTVSLHVDETLRKLVESHGPLLVVHGAAAGVDRLAAAGVDRLAAAAARRHGCEVRAYRVTDLDRAVARARWGNARNAPLARTVRMLDDAAPNLLYAWWDGRSRGTGFTLGECGRRSIPVRLFRIDVQAAA